MTRNLSVLIAKVNADCHQVSHSQFYLWFTSKTSSYACLFVLVFWGDIEKLSLVKSDLDNFMVLAWCSG